MSQSTNDIKSLTNKLEMKQNVLADDTFNMQEVVTDFSAKVLTQASAQQREHFVLSNHLRKNCIIHFLFAFRNTRTSSNVIINLGLRLHIEPYVMYIIFRLLYILSYIRFNPFHSKRPTPHSQNSVGNVYDKLCRIICRRSTVQCTIRLIKS